MNEYFEPTNQELESLNPLEAVKVLGQILYNEAKYLGGVASGGFTPPHPRGIFLQRG